MRIDNNKKVILIVILILLALTVTSCGSDVDDSMDKYFKLKDDFTTFANKVYNPSKEADLIIGVNTLKPYITERLHEELQRDLGQYTPESKYRMTELNVTYIRKENSLNNKFNKMNISFRLEDDERSQLQAIEFVENNEGIFDRYHMFYGITEVK